MGKNTKESKSEYQLYSVINHRGGTASGHYTAVCHEPANNTWVNYDDDKFETWDENDLENNKQAYLYFYKRKEDYVAVEDDRRKEAQILEGEPRDGSDRPRRNVKPSTKVIENKDQEKKKGLEKKTTNKDRVPDKIGNKHHEKIDGEDLMAQNINFLEIAMDK